MINNDWDNLLKPEFQKSYFIALVQKVKDQYAIGDCYPPINKVFDALRKTSFAATKVVILGQDPYHNPNEAMGLCFSVPEGIAFPPSLANILTELNHDLGYEIPQSGDLSKWADQGVLLLNTILSVSRNKPLSHQNLGWLTFTDHIISLLNTKPGPMVFVLWGSHARSKKVLLNNPQHLIIENVHPSPLSAYRGFFGSKPFSKINTYLLQNGVAPIDFNLCH
ncbi:MAG: uracil-DNA glycosylase [Candidatus Izemoplasmatales bacterium]